MKNHPLPWLALLAFPFLLFANPVKDAKDILAQSKLTGGLIVYLGCGTGDLLAALGKDERFLVHGLELDSSAALAPWHGKKGGILTEPPPPTAKNRPARPPYSHGFRRHGRCQ